MTDPIMIDGRPALIAAHHAGDRVIIACACRVRDDRDPIVILLEEPLPVASAGAVVGFSFSDIVSSAARDRGVARVIDVTRRTFQSGLSRELFGVQGARTAEGVVDIVSRLLGSLGGGSAPGRTPARGWGTLPTTLPRGIPGRAPGRATGLGLESEPGAEAEAGAPFGLRRRFRGARRAAIEYVREGWGA